MNYSLNSQVVFSFVCDQKGMEKSTKEMETYMQSSPLSLQGALLSSGTNCLKLLILAKEQDLKRNCNNMTVSIPEWRNGCFLTSGLSRKVPFSPSCTSPQTTFRTKCKAVQQNPQH